MIDLLRTSQNSRAAKKYAPGAAHSPLLFRRAHRGDDAFGHAGWWRGDFLVFLWFSDFLVAAFLSLGHVGSPCRLVRAGAFSDRVLSEKSFNFSGTCSGGRHAKMKSPATLERCGAIGARAVKARALGATRPIRHHAIRIISNKAASTSVVGFIQMIAEIGRLNAADHALRPEL
ncbi:hypothetical protein [Methylovirgula sp. HY1]|uniref:hypothetical protein n=1 Tax=Methylovirgula sp. HY1 TaxID=2822761 RepID=UPI001C5BD83A|nr:hypothetical protein [Methylovirgula sp. HY1]